MYSEALNIEDLPEFQNRMVADKTRLVRSLDVLRQQVYDIIKVDETSRN
jgi:hypothetical protein